MILLENVSGTGITIGSNFKELYDIIKKINAKERIEFQDINIILDLIDRNIDLEKLLVIHNDSKQQLGTKKDEYTHIGDC